MGKVLDFVFNNAYQQDATEMEKQVRLFCYTRMKESNWPFMIKVARGETRNISPRTESSLRMERESDQSARTSNRFLTRASYDFLFRVPVASMVI
jgi:hypothetical protein